MNARSLCVVSIPTLTENLTFPALLFYENSTGGISALLRSNSDGIGIDYVDVTNQSNVFRSLSAPFACPLNSTKTEGPTFYQAPDSSLSMNNPKNITGLTFETAGSSPKKLQLDPSVRCGIIW